MRQRARLIIGRSKAKDFKSLTAPFAAEIPALTRMTRRVESAALTLRVIRGREGFHG
jgi:hypothetical protein